MRVFQLITFSFSFFQLLSLDTIRKSGTHLFIPRSFKFIKVKSMGIRKKAIKGNEMES